MVVAAAEVVAVAVAVAVAAVAGVGVGVVVVVVVAAVAVVIAGVVVVAVAVVVVVVVLAGIAVAVTQVKPWYSIPRFPGTKKFQDLTTHPYLQPEKHGLKFKLIVSLLTIKFPKTCTSNTIAQNPSP